MKSKRKSKRKSKMKSKRKSKMKSKRKSKMKSKRKRIGRVRYTTVEIIIQYNTILSDKIIREIN